MQAVAVGSTWQSNNCKALGYTKAVYPLHWAESTVVGCTGALPCLTAYNWGIFTKENA